MSMIIADNMMATNTSRTLGTSGKKKVKTAEKLASGYKVNSGSDDAAGLTISEKMRGQIKSLRRSAQNAMDGISMIQTADSALDEAYEVLQRMNTLAAQAANDTNTSADRQALQEEIDQLTDEVDRIATTTQFNTMNLLDGTFTGKNLEVGTEGGKGIEVSIRSTKSTDLGVRPLSVGSFADASSAMSATQDAITQVSMTRTQLSATQKRVEDMLDNIQNAAEGTQRAESIIRDTDMASASVESSTNNILMQAGQAILSQANQSPQGVTAIL